MAGTIKGITVEIGGNTTQLQKALSEVNSKTKDINLELGQVSKLLKLDPSNTTLLAQKQQLLSDAIASSSSKLETLKSVQSQVEQQFASGDIGESQYRAFQRQIESTEISLKKFTDQQNELGSESSIAGNEVKDLGNSFDNTGSKALSFGDVLKANLISDAIVTGVKAIGSAIADIAKGFVGAASSAATYADDIDTLATQTGLATDTIQGMSYAAKLLDVDVETQAKGLGKVVNAIDSANSAGQDYIQVADGLKVSIKDANGNLKSSEDVYYSTIDALGSMTNATEQEAAAQNIFGKSYQDLQPLIKAGSTGLKELTEQAEQNGYILGGSALSALQSYKDSLDTLNNEKTAFTNAFGAAMAPTLQVFTDAATDATSALTQLVNGSIDSEGFATKISGIVSGVTNKINSSLPALLNVAESIVTALGNGIISALPTIATAAVNIITELSNSLITALPSLASAAISIIGQITQSIVDNLPALLEAALQIILQLATDISDSLPGLIPTIIGVIAQIVQTLIDNVEQLVDAALQIILALANGLIAALPRLISAVPQLITSLVNALTNPTMLAKMIEAALQLILALGAGLIDAIPQLVANIPQIIDAIVTGLKNGLEAIREVGSDIVNGIWEGIASGWDWLTSKVENLAMSLLDSVKNALGIHSPSKLFRDQVGQWIPAGIALGITDNASVVTDAMSALDFKLGNLAVAGSVPNSYSNSYYNTYSTSNGGDTVTLSIGDIYLSGVDNTDQFADALVRKLPSAFLQRIYMK